MLKPDAALDARALRRLDRLIWAIVAVVAATVLAAPLLSEFRIAWHSFAPPALAVTILVAAGSFYRRWRDDPRLASGLTSTAQVVAFAAAGAPLSYLAASADLPLHDHALAAIDRALGLDWTAMLAWMNAAPVAFGLLRPIYLSLTLQMTAAVLCLAFSGRLAWLRVYTLAFILAALISIAISALLPAAGAWPHYAPSPSDSPHLLPTVSTSWPVFYGLRDGTFRSLVAIGSEGIITFPSLHAALAVIVVAALWPVPVARWLFLMLNLLMLVATPVDGSHYFIDVLAGVVLAVLSLICAQMLAARLGAAPQQQRTGIAAAGRPATA
jgi:membrane-associated phospholipid phosphatase